MPDPLFSVIGGTSGRAVAGLLRVLYPDARTVLDTTYGKGQFWTDPMGVRVYGMDRDPRRAPDVVGDFRAIPFEAGTFDVVVFDPPYHTDMGKGKPSIMGARFATFGTVAELEAAVREGARECARVARLGVIVKCQDYIHASRPVWMSRWLWDELGEPFDCLHQTRGRKLMDRKWTRQLSVWRVHATYWCWRKDGLEHKARRTA